jgi:prepilin-type N-terminal cleavage/methylation domain-containing protein
MQPFRVTNRCAFSLTELLVAISVLGLMVALLGTMTSNVSNVWSKGNAQIDRRRNVRAIVDLVKADLRGALLPVDPSVEPTKPNLQFILNPGGISADYNHPDAIFWQAPVATDQSRGDIAEVGYFVKWDVETTPENPRAMLCRLFVNPTDTANYRIYSDRTKWLNDRIIEAVAPANNGPDATGQPAGWRGLVAEDVVGFWARWTDSGNKQVKVYDSRVARALPKLVEISVVQLDARAAARITPELQARIAELTRETSDANHFLQRFRELPEFTAIFPGAHAMSASIRLENAR